LALWGDERRSLIGGRDMPSEKPGSIFLQEVMDISEQLTLLDKHRKGLLEADTIVAFHNALERFHLSMEVLQVCVSGLRHRVTLTQRDTYGVRASAEAGASGEADTRGGLIRALLKRRGLG